MHLAFALALLTPAALLGTHLVSAGASALTESFSTASGEAATSEPASPDQIRPPSALARFAATAAAAAVGAAGTSTTRHKPGQAAPAARHQLAHQLAGGGLIQGGRARNYTLSSGSTGPTFPASSGEASWVIQGPSGMAYTVAMR